MVKWKDYPIAECAKAADKIIKDGGTVYQKWTCDKCGERVTGNNPNTLTLMGHHEDCGHITDIGAKGCNYMVLFSAGVKP